MAEAWHKHPYIIVGGGAVIALIILWPSGKSSPTPASGTGADQGAFSAELQAQTALDVAQLQTNSATTLGLAATAADVKKSKMNKRVDLAAIAAGVTSAKYQKQTAFDQIAATRETDLASILAGVDVARFQKNLGIANINAKQTVDLASIDAQQTRDLAGIKASKRISLADIATAEALGLGSINLGITQSDNQLALGKYNLKQQFKIANANAQAAASVAQTQAGSTNFQSLLNGLLGFTGQAKDVAITPVDTYLQTGGADMGVITQLLGGGSYNGASVSQTGTHSTDFQQWNNGGGGGGSWGWATHGIGGETINAQTQTSSSAAGTSSVGPSPFNTSLFASLWSDALKAFNLNPTA
jgi:hypothetical protein